MTLEWTVAVSQGAFYVATGLWSLVDIDSFQRVTGPKRDVWLVKTVGVLVVVIGSVLLMAAARHRVGFEIAVVGSASAGGLALVEGWYVMRGVIARIYAADAALEVALAAGWLASGALA